MNEQIDKAVRHIGNVHKFCKIIAYRLYDKGDHELARKLLYNSLAHDQSKFSGLEWEVLVLPENKTEHPRFQEALKLHNTTNKHHPEHWGSIHLMPDEYVAEMTMDWKARSLELGSDFKTWVNECATKRFCFSQEDEVYNKIMYFYELSLDKF